ncbi:PH domain-containing protein [Hyphomonadaceae bacterium ML37]|nr:PH domain-containing protein [Hyphomonadaceae bacterium ML37]
MQNFDFIRENGREIYRTRPAWRSYWGSWIVLGVTIALCIRFYSEIPQQAYPYIAGWLIAVSLFMAGRRQMEAFDLIDGQVIRAHKGLVVRKRRDVTLSPQVHVDMEQGVMGRTLNYATLSFWTGDDRSTANWSRITNPERVIQELEALKTKPVAGSEVRVAETDNNQPPREQQNISDLPFQLVEEGDLRPIADFHFSQPIAKDAAGSDSSDPVSSSREGNAPRSGYHAGGGGTGYVQVTHQPSGQIYHFNAGGYVWKIAIDESGMNLYVSTTPFISNRHNVGDIAMVTHYTRAKKQLGSGFKYIFAEACSLPGVSKGIVAFKVLKNGGFVAMINKAFRESSRNNMGPGYLLYAAPGNSFAKVQTVASGSFNEGERSPDYLGSVAINHSQSLLAQLSYVENGTFSHISEQFGHKKEPFFRAQIQVYDLKSLALIALHQLDETYAHVEQEGYMSINPYMRVGFESGSDTTLGINVGMKAVRAFNLRQSPP